MGTLMRFELGRMIRDFDTRCLFETGTFLGDGIAYGVLHPFEKIVSIEIIPEIAAKAKQRFAMNGNVIIIESDSVSGLEQLLPGIKQNIIFWLDAHFPGADAGLSRYDESKDEALRLPLQKEIETIYRIRKGYNDIFILDDLRIYEDGNYEKGNVPADALPALIRNIDFIYEYFSETHFIFKSYLDEGYVIVLPRKKYKRAHFSYRDIFRKRAILEDHYLSV